MNSVLRARERLYRVLWTLTDRRGVVQRTQQEIAELMDLSYQQLSVIMREFVEMGMMHKDKHKWTVLHNPNKIPWATGYKEMRDRYIQELGPINASKANRTRGKDVLDIP